MKGSDFYGHSNQSPAKQKSNEDRLKENLTHVMDEWRKGNYEPYKNSTHPEKKEWMQRENKRHGDRGPYYDKKTDKATKKMNEQLDNKEFQKHSTWNFGEPDK